MIHRPAEGIRQMASCEKCWSEASRRALLEGGSVSDHYYRVMKEVEDSGNVCTPRERAGQFWDEATQRDTRVPTGDSNVQP